MDNKSIYLNAFNKTKGLVDINKFYILYKNLKEEVQSYNPDTEYLEVRKYWFFLDEEFIPKLGEYVEHNRSLILEDETYAKEFSKCLSLILMVKLDSAIRYGRVQEGSLPIMGFFNAYLYSDSDEEVITYIKEICRIHNMDESEAVNDVEEMINQGWGAKYINSVTHRLENFSKDSFKG